MKVLIPTYTFNASSGEITVLNYNSFKLEQLLLITNTSRNRIIYNFADAANGGFVSNNVIYLSADTSSMEDSDGLQIFIEDYFLPSSEATLTAVNVELQKSNTLLDVLTGQQTTVNLDVSAINLNTDGLETLITNSNTLLAQINTSTSELTGISGLLAESKILLSSISNDSAVGTTSDNPLFVNQGTISYTTDSVNIDKDINQTSTTSLTSKLIVSGNRRLYSVFGISTSNDNQYIQIYNTSSNIPTGTPANIFYVPANSNFSFDFNRGLNFSNGVLIVNSLTPINYTSGNNDLFLTVVFN